MRKARKGKLKKNTASPLPYKTFGNVQSRESMRWGLWSRPDTCCLGFYGEAVLMSLIASKEMTSRVLHQKGLNFYQVLISLGDSMGEI